MATAIDSSVLLDVLLADKAHMESSEWQGLNLVGPR